MNFLKSQILSLVSIFGTSKLTDISGIKNHPSLKELDIESCKNIPVDHLIDVVTSCKNLEVLKLSHFEFPDLDWVREMKSLKQLVIIDCNVLNGDIGPAAQLEYIAIDNRKHYNYKFDSVTRTIYPVAVKLKNSTLINEMGKKNSIIDLPFFGKMDCENLQNDFFTDLVLNDLRINLEIHFVSKSIAKAKLNRVIKLLNDLANDIILIHQIFIKNFQESGVIREYYDFFIDQNVDGNESEFWKKLSLHRIAFYPEDDEIYAIYDFVIDELIPYLVSLKINSKGKIADCKIES